MKLNLDKVDTMYSAVIGGETYKYGWYSKLVPKCGFNLYDYFYVGTKKYKKTIDGIVRYLIEKYNGD